MGKTEKGAVWLDPSLCSPYDYFQYWVNVHDDDVGRFLRLYTFMPIDAIAELEALEGAAIRDAKAVLAFEATKLAHGESEASKARDAAKAAFSGGISADMPSAGVVFPIGILDALVASGLCSSKGDARRQIQQGAVRTGARRDEQVTQTDATVGEETVLWRGKKNCVRLVSE